MAVAYLIRHGQASFGAANYDALSEIGKQQSTVLGLALRDRLPSEVRIISGAMVRHRETAGLCLAALGRELPETVLPAWNEYDHMGVLEGYHAANPGAAQQFAELAASTGPHKAFQDMFDQALRRWVNATDDPAYAENWTAFTARARTALDTLLDGLGSAGTALVFTSGGPISAICAGLLGLPAEGWLALNRVVVNSSLTKIVRGRSGTSLISFNDHAHLESAPRELLTYR